MTSQTRSHTEYLIPTDDKVGFFNSHIWF